MTCEFWGFFNQYLTIVVFEDLNSFVKYSLQNCVSYVSRNLVIYRLHLYSPHKYFIPSPQQC